MDQPPSTEKTGPQRGDVIDGNLEIEGIIAEGRTSTVVAAIDRGNGSTKIAVKVARGSDLESLERFKRAARGMAKLTSPYVVKVLGVGTTAEGAPCMNMEYLEGRTLGQKITQSGPLPIDEAVKWMLQVCDAVADAHAHNLLHRDLDAENLFLAMPPLGKAGAEPSIRVLDFGLAPVWRLGKGDGRLRPGDVPGTSFAMPPELARGSDLDERVDVWGVGACLFRLLTAKYPYNARNLAELCTRILAERAPDLTKLRADVTPGLAAFVQKCLEREPGDRFQSMREVITALEDTKDEAPLTPQVHTERATLEQLREIEDAQSRMTPMVFRAAAPREAVPSSDQEDATSIHQRPAFSIGGTPKTDKEKRVHTPDPAADPFDAATAVRHVKDLVLPKPVPPPAPADAFHSAETPHTMRIAPDFEAMANRLEPPKPKRSEPPPRKSGPLPPPMPPPRALQIVAEDGPSTQPLGRLSPFAELPKSSPEIIDREPPSDEHSIAPRLIGVGPAVVAPLPVPSLETMAKDTMAPPAAPATPVGLALAPTEALMPPLPRPSPAMMAAETIPRGMAPPVAPTQASPLVFQAQPRVLELPSSPPLMGPPVMPTPRPSGGPPPMFTGPPAAPMPSAPQVVAAQDEEDAPRKSRLIVPLIFALGLAASIVVGLYVARATLPKPAPDATKPSATPSETVAAPPESAQAGSIASSDTETPELTTLELDAGTDGGTRRHHTRRPPPPTQPSTTPAPVKSGSVYDPSLY